MAKVTPIVQYIVVRKDLAWPAGALMAQACHGRHPHVLRSQRHQGLPCRLRQHAQGSSHGGFNHSCYTIMCHLLTDHWGTARCLTELSLPEV